MGSAEIIHNTDFNILRRDRSDFDSAKTSGGGVCCFINEKWQHKEVTFDCYTYVEFQCLHLQSTADDLILVNVYCPPASSKDRILSEFNVILSQLCGKYSNHHIIVIGDFNLPSITWNIVNTTTSVSEPSFDSARRGDKNIVLTFQKYGFTQVNKVPNARGVWLDLCFSNRSMEV